MKVFCVVLLALLLGGCAPVLRVQAPPVNVSADVGGDLDTAVSTTEDFWRREFSARGLSFRPVDRVFPYDPPTRESCGDAPLPAQNAVFCPDGDFIAYDAAFVQQLSDQLGDASIYFLIGHEYGHAVQDRLGIRSRFSIQQELQADCFAGAYIGDRTRAGELTLEPGDISELQNSLEAVGDRMGSPWFAPNAHGTAAQRVSAFAQGYRNSLTPCLAGS